MKMCELNPTVRPYERLERFGASALSDEELLAIVLRTGMKGKSSKEIAEMILSSDKMANGLSGFHRMTLSELSAFEGIGRVKAIVLKACMELGKRSVMMSDNESIRFSDCEVSRRFFEERMAFIESEEVQAAYVDAQKRLIHHETVCKGSVNRVGMCMREVFRTAVRVNADGMILAHNHPGGTLSVSDEDISATALAVQNGHLIGIEVIDHIIVAEGASISMRNLGLMEE